MRNNKILATAIASALSLGTLGTLSVSAAELELRAPHNAQAKGDALDSLAGAVDAQTYAAELFSDKTQPIAEQSNSVGVGVTLFKADGSFTVAFPIGVKADYPVSGSNILNVKATLSKGTWAGGVDPDTQVILCGTAALTAGSCGGDDYSGTTKARIIKGSYASGTKDNIADFNIYPGTGAGATIASTAYLFFSFAVDDLTDLKKSGSLSLSMESSADFGGGGAAQVLSTGQSVKLANSLPAINVNIQGEFTPTVAIDVDQELKGFLEGTSTQKDTVCLGFINLTGTNPLPRAANGTDGFTFNPVGGTAVLQIANAPFAASGGKVFLTDDADNKTLEIDPDSNGQWDAGEDMVAKSIDSTGARWEFEEKHLNELYNAIYHICLQADKVNEINEQTSAPTATFTLRYTATSAEQTYPPRRLRHIKNNGSNCTLYNIPDGTAGLAQVSVDKLRIKVHNRSTGKTGTLKGSLYGQDGRVLFQNVNLLPDAAVFGPGMTVNLNTGEGNDYDLTKYATEHWVGERAILKLTSNLQREEFEAFGLVRSQSDQSVGNLSHGASGGGCQ